ncbi:MAG: peptide chain release factor N(5)-glutamine methyltransferase [Winogradskyella sp.]|uniref:peptide chain release factor N(5)-glutamine methyltransferase n=1 Tax=Winogradskyella sp. TaxID=1883156 RepID=UPI0017EA948D|nr:peptide chain release factor N(5)-glutamine methyltransferase [Winogradskyella sp.]MBT8245831.1 peptide chain release factor N(5)-glutamine methyltransferase [Winogradskyella sp.]NNK22602.1 peptide chain release factor N(5)-glutamine methyltransferase [Winogradskyella sp.]
MKALDLKHVFQKELGAIYDKNEVASFFFLCLEYFLEVPRIQLILEPEFSISKAEVEDFFRTLEALKKQKPIQYIFGETEFYGLKFKVNENVLIPRQETEELISLIIEDSKLKSQNPIIILDVGTGSGCIAITLAKNIPNAKVYAVDVSKEALEIAKENAELNNVNVHFIKYDILNRNNWSSNFKDLEFDFIVSNPPYVRNLEKAEIQPNVLDYEPHLALFVEDDNPLIFYSAITNFAIHKLKLSGHLFFEINQYLGNETKQLLVDANFNKIELKKDLNNNDRILKAVKK